MAARREKPFNVEDYNFIRTWMPEMAASDFAKHFKVSEDRINLILSEMGESTREFDDNNYCSSVEVEVYKLLTRWERIHTWGK